MDKVELEVQDAYSIALLDAHALQLGNDARVDEHTLEVLQAFVVVHIDAAQYLTQKLAARYVIC